ncbi:MAG: DEAD/DEAH box helicase [Halofilum sp. (in: g-proteobacteria)]
MRVQLRDYQQDAVDALREAYRQGSRAPLLASPTGSGKTVMFAHIAEQAYSRGRSVMILVHRRELLGQTSQALTNIGVRHQLIAPAKAVNDMRSYQLQVAGGSWVDQTSRLQVASVQTLVRRLDCTPEPDLIVIDEAHHAVAGSWGKVIEAFPRARLLGVTATPHRLDGKGLGVQAGGPFDTLVHGPSVRDLIDRGYLAEPVVYAPPVQADLDGVHTRGGDYVTGELAERLDRPRITGDAIDHYRRICSGAPAIAFCASVQHAEHVAEQFRQAGYRWQRVDGTMSSAARDRAIRGLADGSLHGISSCEIVNEGTDVPVVTAGIMLRATKSLPLWLQQCGRVLRTHKHKDKAYILDHVGNSLRHGLPDWEREWSLDGEVKKGGKKSSDPTPPIRQCPRCYAAHAPAPVCPACGHRYEAATTQPEQEEGELSEFTPEQAEAMKRRQKREVAQAQTLDDLKRIEKARGYKPGWADHVFRARKKKEGA